MKRFGLLLKQLGLGVCLLLLLPSLCWPQSMPHRLFLRNNTDFPVSYNTSRVPTRTHDTWVRIPPGGWTYCYILDDYYI